MKIKTEYLPPTYITLQQKTKALCLGLHYLTTCNSSLIIICLFKHIGLRRTCGIYMERSQNIEDKHCVLVATIKEKHPIQENQYLQ